MPQILSRVMIDGSSSMQKKSKPTKTSQPLEDCLHFNDHISKSLLYQPKPLVPLTQSVLTEQDLSVSMKLPLDIVCWNWGKFFLACNFFELNTAYFDESFWDKHWESSRLFLHTWHCTCMIKTLQTTCFKVFWSVSNGSIGSWAFEKLFVFVWKCHWEFHHSPVRICSPMRLISRHAWKLS